jgi:hypothetical protein
MTKTWLMRRSVRRPVLLDVTSRMSSSVWRLPFIKSSALDCWMSSTAFAAAAWLCGHVDDLEATDVETVLAGDSANLGGRSDKDGNDDAGVRRFDRAAQRCLFAGVNDGGPRGRHLLGPGDQPLVLRSGGIADGAERRDVADLTVLQHDGSSRAFRPKRSVRMLLSTGQPSGFEPPEMPHRGRMPGRFAADAPSLLQTTHPARSEPA